MIEFIGYFFVSIALLCALFFCCLVLAEGYKEYKAGKGNSTLIISLMIVMLMTLVISGGAYLFEQHFDTMRIINK